MKSPNTWRALKYLRKNVGLLLLGLCAGLLTAVLTPISPLVLREMIDHGFRGTSRYSLAILLFAFTMLPLLGIVLNSIRTWAMMQVGHALLANLRTEVYQKMHSKSLTFFTERPSGEIVSRIVSDADSITSFPDRIVTSLSDVVTAISILVAAFTLNWRVSLLLLALGPMLLLPLPLLGTVMYRSTKRIYESVERFHAFLQQSLSLQGIVLAKCLGTAEEETRRFHILHSIAVRDTIKGFLWKTGMENLTNVLMMLPITLLFWLSATRYAADLHLSPGTLLAFASYLGGIFQPFSTAARLGVTFRSSEALFERIFEYIDAPEDPKDSDTAIDVADITGKIEFRDVTFTYPSSGRGVRSISVTIEPGEVVAIVGPSGAGKSTLGHLLMRLYEPTSGQILIGGIDIQQIQRKALARHVGIVTQEPYLFYGTVFENITYGTPNATVESVEEAARAACILDFIQSLPDGFHTIVGETGYRLSGGEKQRIAIARVFLHNPRILILDEATSALDSISEAAIRSALEHLMKNRTTLLITHRLSMLETVDRILVMQGGRIVESGTKEELLRAGGLFALMYHQQFPSHVAEVALPS